MHVSVSLCFMGLNSYELLKPNPDIFLSETDQTGFCAHIQYI